MKRWLVLILVLFCFGCATTWTPKCRHEALYTASVAGEDYPVRIAWGDNHVQAQALIEGEWKFLVLSQGWVVTRDLVNGFEPTHFESFDDYADRFKEWFAPQ